MIRFEQMELPAAELGPENPLPDLSRKRFVSFNVKSSERVSAEEASFIGKGMVKTMIPYLKQDGYDRQKTMKKFDTVVLENDYLKAVFVPALGGRLWQLYDKEKNQDLLYTNPVFQPCNLALRNAWFSGGVEFNLGMQGHTPFTCSQLFCEKRRDKDGKEFVCMFEYERIRGVAYSVNIYLPEDSKVLYVKNVIENTKDEDCYMYWWTNMAVPETPNTRVIVPAVKSFVNKYKDGETIIDKVDVPYETEADSSYSINIPHAIDYFFDIPTEENKWITAVDKDGYGLLHYSQDVLIGRKLFVWGQGQGGRHWNEYLSTKEAGPYIEIQAGLAHTQYEHFIMEKNSTIEWVEAFTAIQGEPSKLHDKDWSVAIKEVNRLLLEQTGGKKAEEALTPVFPDVYHADCTERLCEGSGWGRLENLVRAQLGTASISRVCNDWGNGTTQTDRWEHLMQTGLFEEEQPLHIPDSYINGHYWIDLLENSLENGEHFTTYLQLGTALFEAGEEQNAYEMWKKSAELQPNPWALRNMAAWLMEEGHDLEAAADYSVQALEMLPDNRHLAIDCSKILMEVGQNERLIQVVEALPAQVQALGRVQLAKAMALIALDRLEEAAELINTDYVLPDVQEGEISVSAAWIALHEKLLMREGLSEKEAKEQVLERYPIPYVLDFRMG
ncbi:MAG: DUF5107 domain-containing protein [Agathobacter sp.]|nr:DUF5107 domain-containing protein [Agathobacter sp.]